MAASFCTACGGPLDAEGICARRCEAVVLPATDEPFAVSAAPYDTTSQGYGRGAPPPPPPYTTAPEAPPPYATPQITRFSGMWNWGGFLLCPFWLMNHGGLGLGIGYLVLTFIPGLNIATLGMAIYFGIKGNDWAVQHRNFVDEAQFVAVQNAWRNWGFIVAGIGIIFGIIGAILLGILGVLTGAHSHALT